MNNDIVMNFESCPDCGSEWSLQPGPFTNMFKVSLHDQFCLVDVAYNQFCIWSTPANEKWGQKYWLRKINPSIQFHSSEQRDSILDIRLPVPKFIINMHFAALSYRKIIHAGDDSSGQLEN